MKRFIKIPLILFTTAFLFMASCSDDFLSPDPKSFFAPENIYTDRAGFEALLVTMRRTIAHAEHIGGRGNMLILAQWTQSEAAISTWLPDQTVLNPSGSGRIAWYNQVSFSEDAYEYIKDANVIVSRIDDIEWQSMQDRNEVLAEALWFRSYWYNRLVHSYGDVPFVGEEILEPKLDFQTHSRKAILDRIQADMEWAVQHLPESAVPGAVTRGAGNHLLAKIYLANLEFEQAIEAATRVIDGPYALMTGRFGVDADDPVRNVIWDLHRPLNKNHSQNTETLLAIVDRYDAPEGARSSLGSRTMRTYHPDWWNSAHHTDSEGGAGMTDSGSKYDSLGRGNPDVALNEFLQYHVWDSKYEAHNFSWDETPDLRRADINWVDVHEMRYNNPNSVNYGEQWRMEWTSYERAGRMISSMYAMPVYKTMIREGSPDRPPFGGHADWYIYRLAETYLIRAEANYWLNRMQDAADDINEVRARAEAPLINAGDVTIDYIFDERVRELSLEGMQHNELVRVSFTMAELGGYGYDLENLHESNWWYDRVISRNFFYPEHPFSGESISIGVPYPIGDTWEVTSGIHPRINPHHFLWPVSANMIDSNALGRVNQNLGYTGAERNEPPLESIPPTEAIQ